MSCPFLKKEFGMKCALDEGLCHYSGEAETCAKRVDVICKKCGSWTLGGVWTIAQVFDEKYHRECGGRWTIAENIMATGACCGSTFRHMLGHDPYCPHCKKPIRWQYEEVIKYATKEA